METPIWLDGGKPWMVGWSENQFFLMNHPERSQMDDVSSPWQSWGWVTITHTRIMSHE